MRIFFLEWNAEYEISAIDYLKRSNNNIFSLQIKLPKFLNSLNKKLLKFKINNTWLVKLYSNYFINKYGLNEYDLLICKEPNFINYIQILDQLPCKKILICRHILKEGEEQGLKIIRQQPENSLYKIIMKCRFNQIYSFDHLDCQKYKFEYMPLFFSFGFNEIDQINFATQNKTVKKCFFLGRDKNRIKIIEDLSRILEGLGCIADFYVTKDNSSKSFESKFYIDHPVNYKWSLDKTIQADIIIDINQEGQTGLTLRALEAIFFNKKLISNNSKIKEYDFYSSSQFFIFGEDKISDLSFFLNQHPPKIPKNIYYSYSPDYMLEKIINDYRANFFK